MTQANFRGVLEVREKGALSALRAAIRGGEETQISGCFGSAAPFLLANALDGMERPAVVVLQDEGDLSSFVAEMKLWSEGLDLFHDPFVHASVTTLEHAALLQQMKAIRAMLEPEARRGVWVSTLQALSAPCFSLDFIDEPVMTFEPGQTWSFDDLGDKLEKRGFQRQDRVDQRGDYSFRGGILDLFPRFAEHPLRVEFFGEEVDTLREFSAVTQKSLRTVSRYVLDDMNSETVQEMQRTDNLLDYLPEGTLFLVQEPELSLRGVEGPRSGLAHVLSDLQQRQERSILRSDFGRELEDSPLRFNTKMSEPLGFTVQDAVEHLEAKGPLEHRFWVEPYGSSLKLAERCRTELWTFEGSLEQNFTIEELGVEVLHESNLVQISEVIEEQSQSDAVADFVDMEMGDYVVHEQYGVGQFLGLASLEKKGTTSDYLLLQFAGGSKVYVSVTQLSQVQKYIGRSDGAPELSKLGTKSWEMKKKRARKAIERIVMELVHRQAFRESQKGFAYSSDTPEQRAFERAFPYEDTPCQTLATASIKRDMEKHRAMDHLLCGDVGFGKTEVAMRIAHKSMLDGKQVALLAPTTVLAEQHYNNFCKRFADKAHQLAVLDRFRSAKEIREILLKVAAGEVMVLIGTHRLLSKDIEFADLGMMILDEEQRFGVKQKEALKKRYPSIDVLSLSATPIPRTLHLSMLGIRGISNLTVPPENRHPIRTYIRERDRGIILHAINRELARGGQSYFLHNRVEDIHKVKEELQGYFPEARIGVGHGQMKENELSEVMRAFYALEIDIFLSTSIVANGIDIPTANTMVVNDAHLFGLSELHQIRGRIGRYSIQAYCYLLLPPGSKLPKESMRRLRAVEEHQDLGSGFKLAMKDMEIRGVGNILGEDQHGQIADIGYELYTQYLATAIAEQKGQEPEPFLETELDWNFGSTYIPKKYIPSHSDRIEFYRRISFAKSSSRIDQLSAEMRDRFGKLPKPTSQLLSLFGAKTRLKELGIVSFKGGDGGRSVMLESHGWPDELKLEWVLAHPGELAFHGETHIVLKVDQIWNTNTDEKAQQDPYTAYSYYNEDNRPEPSEVMELLLDFITRTLRSARRAFEEKQESIP